MIERHRNVGAEHPLDLRGALRREGAAAAVYVTLKLHAAVVHPAESLEREHLEAAGWTTARSEEHTSELQSRENLVCRLLLEKKKKKKTTRKDATQKER